MGIAILRSQCEETGKIYQSCLAMQLKVALMEVERDFVEYLK